MELFERRQGSGFFDEFCRFGVCHVRVIAVGVGVLFSGCFSSFFDGLVGS